MYGYSNLRRSRTLFVSIAFVRLANNVVVWDLRSGDSEFQSEDHTAVAVSSVHERAIRR